MNVPIKKLCFSKRQTHRLPKLSLQKLLFKTFLKTLQYVASHMTITLFLASEIVDSHHTSRIVEVPEPGFLVKTEP